MTSVCSCSLVKTYQEEIHLLNTGELAKSTTLDAAATGTRETAIVGWLKYSSNMGWNKRSQSFIGDGLQEAIAVSSSKSTWIVSMIFQ
ncbi:hypothetical protein Tco_1537848, partial [Tanacetum coccineum]